MGQLALFASSRKMCRDGLARALLKCGPSTALISIVWPTVVDRVDHMTALAQRSDRLHCLLVRSTSHQRLARAEPVLKLLHLELEKL